MRYLFGVMFNLPGGEEAERFVQIEVHPPCHGTRNEGDAEPLKGLATFVSFHIRIITILFYFFTTQQRMLLRPIAGTRGSEAFRGS